MSRCQFCPNLEKLNLFLGIGTEIKVGIIIGFVLVLFLIGIGLILRVKYNQPVKEFNDKNIESRKKLTTIGQKLIGEQERQDRRQDNIVSEKSSLFGNRKARRASDESSAKVTLGKKQTQGWF